MSQMKWLCRLGCLVLTVLPVVALAEPDATTSERMHVSIKAGPGINMFGGSGTTDDPFVSYSPRVGWTAGAGVGFQLHEFVATGIELIYSNRGPNVTSETTGDSWYSMDYLEISAVVRASPPLPGKVTPYLSLGPSLAILLDADIHEPDNRQIDITNRAARVDVGLILGIGAAINVSRSGSALIEARYNLGLRNLNTLDASEENEIMHRIVSFTVGYQTDLSIFSGG
jgi:opacity protein-like surface antigen